jgi:alkanesulfonate monooxygenase SsuD/methylene tetrahydromethanopterin reductase-like flavin-dependent oxidoreductase (luciferase family)
MQSPKPWEDGLEYRILKEALEQVELADHLGFHYAWEVEHHFLEEYSHSSAPEVFLAAASRNTKKIRLGHGVVLTHPKYNPPARVAERLATLDLLSDGRVEWGTGESSSNVELGGFEINPETKRDAWQEVVEQTANMMAMAPYPGFSGKFFSMPCRNVVPKPYQRPHPPIWVACSRRSTIQLAARNGIGALVFGFIDPDDAKHWVDEYYSIIKSSQCIPIGHAVNANITMIVGFAIDDDREKAAQKGQEGYEFFSRAGAHYYIKGPHRPSLANLWQDFQASRSKWRLPVSPGIGTPDDVRTTMRKYQASGLDQIGFVQQCGLNQHEDICRSLERFANEIMPEFVEYEDEREDRKAEELEPYIDQALARKQWMAPIAESDIPQIDTRSSDIIASVEEGGLASLATPGHRSKRDH